MPDIVNAIRQMQPINAGNVLAQGTQIQGLQARNELIPEQTRAFKLRNDLTDDTRNALASGDINALAQVDPAMAAQLQGLESAQTQQAMAELAIAADRVATSKDPAALFPLLQGSPPLQQLSESLGIDLAGASIEGLSEDEIRAEAKGLSDALRNNSLRGQGIPAGLRTFNEMTRGLPTSDQQKARRIHLGLDPRAGMSAQERIALSPDLTDLVADSQSQIREATKFAEATGASRSKFIDTGFDTIEKTEKNIRNLSRARAALDAGASTGAIEAKYFPTIRESTIQLEHVQGELGLDIVGAVTFGQLSEKELELAKDVALPTGLQPPALMTWLQEKEAAQQKLVDYYSEQIDFLDQGGSIAGFLREKGRQSGGAEAGFTTDEGGADSTDNDARFQSVWDAAQSGDVLVAPDGTLRRKP